MRFLPILCVVLLAGCADDSTPQGQCEAQAYNDPTVKDLIAKGTSGGGELQEDIVGPRKEAIKAATNRCLAAKGLIRGGGVERMKTR